MRIPKSLVWSGLLETVFLCSLTIPITASGAFAQSDITAGCG